MATVYGFAAQIQIDNTHLKIHQIEKFVYFRREHFDRFLVNLDPVRLFVRLGLRDGSRAAPPRVQHDCVLLTLLQHLVEGRVNGSLLNVFGNTGKQEIVWLVLLYVAVS